MASKLETLAVKLWVGPWGVAESEALKADWHPAGCAAANKTVWPSSVASRYRPQIEIADVDLKSGHPPSVLIAKKKNQWGAGYDMRTEQRKIASKGTAGERVPIVRPRHAFLFFSAAVQRWSGPLCQVADYSIRTHFLRFKVWGSLAPL